MPRGILVRGARRPRKIFRKGILCRDELHGEKHTDSGGGVHRARKTVLEEVMDDQWFPLPSPPPTAASRTPSSQETSLTQKYTGKEIHFRLEHPIHPALPHNCPTTHPVPMSHFLVAPLCFPPSPPRLDSKFNTSLSSSQTLLPFLLSFSAAIWRHPFSLLRDHIQAAGRCWKSNSLGDGCRSTPSFPLQLGATQPCVPAQNQLYGQTSWRCYGESYRTRS